MWVGAIKLLVDTDYAMSAGTKDLVDVSFRRDGKSLFDYPLDFPPLTGIERLSTNIYVWSGKDALPRRNDKTPELPSGEVQIPMPYPSYGIEFSDGLNGHLGLRINIRGDDKLMVGLVELSVKHIKLENGPLGFQLWRRGSHWSQLGSWLGTWILSTDPHEGQKSFDLDVSWPD